MSLALSRMLSRVSGRDSTVGMTCWRLAFLDEAAVTTESINVPSMVGDTGAISCSMRDLIVSFVNAFFFAHCSMCARFCLADFLLVHCRRQATHLDNWTS